MDECSVFGVETLIWYVSLTAADTISKYKMSMSCSSSIFDMLQNHLICYSLTVLFSLAGNTIYDWFIPPLALLIIRTLCSEVSNAGLYFVVHCPHTKRSTFDWRLLFSAWHCPQCHMQTTQSIFYFLSATSYYSWMFCERLCASTMGASSYQRARRCSSCFNRTTVCLPWSKSAHLVWIKPLGHTLFVCVSYCLSFQK